MSKIVAFLTFYFIAQVSKSVIILFVIFLRSSRIIIPGVASVLRISFIVYSLMSKVVARIAYTKKDSLIPGRRSSLWYSSLEAFLL